METRWYNFDPSEQHEGLEKLVVKARQRYTDVGSQLARHFIAKYEKAKHPISRLLRQRDVFDSQVEPKLNEGKVAYVWVDALRFEMARELCEVLGEEFERPQLALRLTQLAHRALVCHRLCLSHKAALAPFQRGS